MKNYRVISRPASFGVGDVLKLTGEQADARAGSLKKTAFGRYKVTKLVTFKVGEVLGIADASSRHLAGCLEEVKPAAKPKPKKKAPAKSAAKRKASKATGGGSETKAETGNDK